LKQACGDGRLLRVSRNPKGSIQVPLSAQPFFKLLAVPITQNVAHALARSPRAGRPRPRLPRTGTTSPWPSRVAMQVPSRHLPLIASGGNSPTIRVIPPCSRRREPSRATRCANSQTQSADTTPRLASDHSRPTVVPWSRQYRHSFRPEDS
jgi:hypothetical protein